MLMTDVVHRSAALCSLRTTGRALGFDQPLTRLAAISGSGSRWRLRRQTFDRMGDQPLRPGQIVLRRLYREPKEGRHSKNQSEPEQDDRREQGQTSGRQQQPPSGRRHVEDARRVLPKSRSLGLGGRVGTGSAGDRHLVLGRLLAVLLVVVDALPVHHVGLVSTLCPRRRARQEKREMRCVSSSDAVDQIIGWGRHSELPPFRIG